MSNLFRTQLPLFERPVAIQIIRFEDIKPHLSAHFIIMNPHPSVYITRRSSGIQPIPREPYAKTDIVTAASPLPGVLQRRDLIRQRFEETDGVGRVQIGWQAAME